MYNITLSGLTTEVTSPRFMNWDYILLEGSSKQLGSLIYEMFLSHEIVFNSASVAFITFLNCMWVEIVSEI